MVTLGSDAHIDVDIANTEYSDKVLKLLISLWN